MGTPYVRVLEDVWPRLAEPIRRLHGTYPMVCASGVLRIERGDSWLARVVARALRLPAPVPRAITRLVVTVDGDAEWWTRSFDGRSFVTRQQSGGTRDLIERFGVLEFHFDIQESGGGLYYGQREVAVRVGPIRIRLPVRWAPKVEAREEPRGPDSLAVAVRAVLPHVGLLVAYDGVITVEGEHT